MLNNFIKKLEYEDLIFFDSIREELGFLVNGYMSKLFWK